MIISDREVIMMALILCPECGREISNQSKICVHCGFPIDSYNGNDTYADTDTLICEINKLINDESLDPQLRPSPRKSFDRSELICPICKSSCVTTGTRGYSLILGFIGAGNTINRCGKCGFSWEPHRTPYIKK